MERFDPQSVRDCALSPDFRAALDDAPGYIYMVEPQTYELVYVNKALREKDGTPPKLGRCFDAAGSSAGPCPNCPVAALIKSGTSLPTELHRPDGSWLLAQASRVNAGGRCFYMISCTDISGQKALEERLRLSAARSERERAILMDSAARDSLTGLLNHASMKCRVAECLCAADSVSTAMLMIDIDNFKAVNDTLGHQTGDEALTRAAGILKASFRDSDLVGRIGGDEFMVFIPDGIDAVSLCHKTRRLLKKLNFTVGGLSLTASVGIALSEGRNTFHTVYSRADRALYEAKRKGKNTFCLYRE